MSIFNRQEKIIKPEENLPPSSLGISFLGQIYRNAKHRFSVAKSISVSSTSPEDQNEEKTLNSK